jgi:hypothetical protein
MSDKAEYVVVPAKRHLGLLDDDQIVSFEPLAYIRKDRLYVVELFDGEARSTFESPEWTRIEET